MERANAQKGSLLVCSPNESDDRARCVSEAVSAYQRARSAYGSLTLLGRGVGAAYCLMLAQRFSPDAVVIAPCDGDGSCTRFFRAFNQNVRGLYAVCCSVRVLMPLRADTRDVKRLRRMLAQTHSREKSCEMYKCDREIELVLKNVLNRGGIIKTLA